MKDETEVRQGETEVRNKQSIPTDLTKPEQEFIEVMKKAFAENTAEPLVARICLDGIHQFLHGSMGDHIENEIAKGLKTFDFSRVDPSSVRHRMSFGDPEVM